MIGSKLIDRYDLLSTHGPSVKKGEKLTGIFLKIIFATPSILWCVFNHCANHFLVSFSLRPVFFSFGTLYAWQSIDHGFMRSFFPLVVLVQDFILSSNSLNRCIHCEVLLVLVAILRLQAQPQQTSCVADGSSLLAFSPCFFWDPFSPPPNQASRTKHHVPKTKQKKHPGGLKKTCPIIIPAVV